MSDVDSAVTHLEPDASGLSLLSLSIAAANATPLSPTSPANPTHTSLAPAAANGLHCTSSAVSQGIPTSGAGPKQHRRLSSTGKARRRLSDARDAAVRPSPAALHTNALSLSTSLPTQALPITTTLPLSSNTNTALSVARKASSSSDGAPTFSPLDEISLFTTNLNGETTSSNGVSVNGAKVSRKKGMDHRCETCSKIYRHPSCLIKHRWEHTPHWREASKFVLSKHQQVQLLEAAAILSHLSPSSATGTSLPEDRSLWPSFLSGGALPPPSTSDAAHPISNSVPASSPMSSMTRATSTGPRLHDYAIPVSAHASGGITQLRPGLLGVPTGPPASLTIISPSPSPSPSRPSPSLSPSPAPPNQPASKTATPPTSNGSLPVPVPMGSSRSTYRRRDNEFGGDDRSESWGSHNASSYHHHHDPYGGPSSSYVSTAGAVSGSFGGGGWSLPRSSIRSISGSSRSRSQSGSDPGSRSDEESEPMDRDEDGDVVGLGLDDGMAGRRYGYGISSREDEEMRLGYSVREEDEYEEVRKDGSGRIVEEETWDGMDMDMDMD